MSRRILHVDMDAFFASVEQREHPEWRGLPVIVGGLPTERRSVVSTASYEARKFGVHSAMPSAEAYRLCPDGIFVRPDMRLYHEISSQIMQVLGEFSPDVMQMSVDEAFVDITGTERLFGPPEQTARALKKAVLERTGLTISVGMASNHYVAKIASGMSKPDGLFIVEEGREAQFMASLPLEKLWGAGRKTQDKLRSLGLTSVEKVSRCSLELLQSNFGRAAGAFLYEASRGQAAEDFAAEAKSRSISAEETYAYDLYDRDSIDTELLSLSYTLMFRLHREGLHSSKVSLKIRYDDFTTVSAQHSCESQILSVEELYSAAKSLFSRKYDGRGGIRLLGLSLRDVDSGAAVQNSLFDEKEQKQRKIEEAIVALQKKDPTVKLGKARLLDKAHILAIAFALLFWAQAVIPLCAKEREQESSGAGSLVFNSMLPLFKEDEEPVSLFKYTIKDNNVEFLAEGWWQAEILGTLSASFGYGNGLEVSASGPVFQQEVDLSVWFLLNQHWYFEASFADSFEKNTVAAGYKGEGVIRHARIANRGIKFPTDYSIEEFSFGMGGGDNEAPGLMLAMQGEKWKADAALRYDMIEAHSALWYGKNKVNKTELKIEGYQTGAAYVLPGAALTAAVSAVYVEHRNGSYKDARGRTYRRLDSSEYLVASSRCQLLLSDSAKAKRQGGTLPAVMVEFEGFARNSIDSLLGTYGTAQSAGSGFLGEIQAWFGSRNPDSAPNVAEFSYGKADNSGLFGTIGGRVALYVQHPAGFSPFAVASRYDAGTIQPDEVRLISAGSGQEVRGVYAFAAENDLSFVSSDLSKSKRAYIDIAPEKSASRPDSALDPSVRYPLADRCPGRYLGYAEADDTVLSVETYTPVTRFDIGTEAIGGTVRVYRNGTIDTQAKYDAESGEVTLGGGAGAYDRIYVTWYEDSENREDGSLAAAAGFLWNFTPRLSADLSVSARYAASNSDTNFTVQGTNSPGFAFAAAGLRYKGDIIEAKNSVGAGMECDDTSSWRRIDGMSGNEPETIFLSKDAASNLPEGIVPSLNPRGAESFPLLSAEGDGTEDARRGSNSGEVDGYDVPLEWNFSGGSCWAAIGLRLGSGSALPASARQFSIGLKNSTPTGENDFDVYLQLGVRTGDKFSYEDSAFIPTWKISEAGAEDVRRHFDLGRAGYQEVTVLLSEQDRARIAGLGGTGARLVVVARDKDSIAQRTGAVYASCYECVGQSFFVSAEGGAKASCREELSTNSSSIAKRFNDGANYMQTIEWKGAGTVRAQKAFSQSDISQYETFGILLYAQKPLGEFEVSCTTEDEDGEVRVLCLKIEGGAIPAGQWIRLEAKTDGSEVRANGVKIAQSRYSLYADDGHGFSTMRVSVEADGDGSLSIDEIYLCDAKIRYSAQDKAEFRLKKDGVVLQAGGFALEDIEFSAQGEASTERYAFAGGRAGLTAAGARIEGNFSKSSEDEYFSQAGHLLRSNGKEGIYKFLGFSEEFSANPDSKALKKENSATLKLSPLKIPLELSAKTESSFSGRTQSQNSKGQLTFNLPVRLAAGASFSQKRKSALGEIEYGPYGEGWRQATKFSFSQGEADSFRRSSAFNAEARTKVGGLSPEAKFETSGTYASNSATTFSDASKLSLSLPIAIERHKLTFSAERKGGGTAESDAGGAYADDCGALFSAATLDYFYTIAPFADLFQESAADKVLAAAKKSQSQFYSTNYSVAWKRPFGATWRDILLPLSWTNAVQRDIRSADTTSDLYQVKSTATWNALNVFGSESALKKFSLYAQDEFNASLGAAAKIPRHAPEDYSLLVEGYVQAGFFASGGASLKSAAEFSFEDKDNCSGKFTLAWSRNAASSPLASLGSLFSDEIRQKKDAGEIPIKKSDSLNFSFSRAAVSTAESVTRKEAFGYAHEVEAKLTKYFSLTSKFLLDAACVHDQIITLAATLGIGGKLEF